MAVREFSLCRRNPISRARCSKNIASTGHIRSNARAWRFAGWSPTRRSSGICRHSDNRLCCLPPLCPPSSALGRMTGRCAEGAAVGGSVIASGLRHRAIAAGVIAKFDDIVRKIGAAFDMHLMVAVRLRHRIDDVSSHDFSSSAGG